MPTHVSVERPMQLENGPTTPERVLGEPTERMKVLRKSRHTIVLEVRAIMKPQSVS